MDGGAIHRKATLASPVVMVAITVAMATVMVTAMAMAIGAEHGCLGFQLLL
jgi:hypothetical protein